MHHGTLLFTWYLRPPSVDHQRRSGLRSADTLALEVPRTRLPFGDRAFSVPGSRTWSSLPINVRSAKLILSFRKCFNAFIPACVFLYKFVRRSCSIFDNCVRRLKFVICTSHYLHNLLLQHPFVIIGFFICIILLFFYLLFKSDHKDPYKD